MEEIKRVIREYINEARLDIFFTRNIVGDTMHTIYKDDKYQVDICYSWGYFEVFGLNVIEQKEISDYYYSLKE